MVAAIIVGYSLGIRTALPRRRMTSAATPNIDKIFSISLALALVGLAATIIDMIATHSFNFSLSGIGTTYADVYDDYQRNSGNYSIDFIIYTISSVPNFIAEVFGIYYFSNLTRKKKIATLVLIFGSLFTFTVGSGKQKELGDIVIFVLAIFAIKFARRGIIITPRNVALGLLVICVGLFGFSYILSARYTAISIDIDNINYHLIQNMAFDQNNAIFKIFGSKWGFALAMFLGYISQGYYGLSLSLNSETTWTYMVGFSYSLSVLANKLLGVPFQYYHSYPYITGASSGWGESHWYSVFPWFASDFTFVGTIPLFAFFAFAYARTWKESVESENPFAILLFTLMTLGAAFIPANNQLFHGPGALLTMIIVLYFYIKYHANFNSSSARG